ncbi:MAG: hypothetical protein ACI9BW_002154 [Gammaproteobacteria bacterium]|jgi:hypothetical protein
MTIQDWGSIGEIVGAIAVLATLIYLAKQVKHGTDVSKIASYHQAIDQIVQAAMDPDFSKLIAKCASGEKLTSEEEARAGALSSCFIYGHEILLHLYAKGQVDEKLWLNIIENNQYLLENEMIFPVLEQRPGPISQDLLKLVASRAK